MEKNQFNFLVLCSQVRQDTPDFVKTHLMNP